MANELHCKIYEQIYLSKISYLEEFCPLFWFLHIEAGNCTNPDLTHQMAVNSIVTENVSDICIFRRNELNVHDAALTEFSLS